MADINQWRRKILPRSKTPTFDQEERSLANASTSNSATPHRSSRAKLANILTHNHALPSTTSLASFGFPDLDSQTTQTKRYCPDVLLMAQVIMTKMIENPHEGLGPNYNSQVFHIVEAYRNLATENDELNGKVRELKQTQVALKEQLVNLDGLALTERNKHCAEIKRLELTVARSSCNTTDLSETLADDSERRATTPYPDVSKQQGTVTTYGEFWHQLGSVGVENGTTEISIVSPSIIPPSTISPTPKMVRNLPQSLVQPLSPASKPREQATTISALVTRFQSDTPQTRARTPRMSISSDTKQSEISLSDDIYSSFSSNGDALSDELSTNSDAVNFTFDKDFESVRHLAEIMAVRHQTGVDEALSKLTDVFFKSTETSSTNVSSVIANGPSPLVSSDLTTRRMSLDSHRSTSSMPRQPGSSNSNTEMQSSQPLPVDHSSCQRLYRSFSFHIGDDRDVEIYHRRQIDRPDADAIRRSQSSFSGSNVTEFVMPSVSECKKTSEHKTAMSSDFPLPSNHELCIDVAAPSLSTNVRLPAGRMRENSSASIETVVHRYSTTPETTNRSTTRPDSVRTSSLQSIMNGLRGDRHSVSATASLRNSSTSSARKNSPGVASETSSLTKEGRLTAIAAARAAGERGGNL